MTDAKPEKGKPEGPFDRPSEVSTDRGNVIVEGPDGVNISMTPDAAIETAGRLFDNGAEALGQRDVEEIRNKPPI